MNQTQSSAASSLPQCPCHMPAVHHCGKELREQRAVYFRRDIDDITDSVMQVMRICGLKAWEVRRTREVIGRSLLHFDEVRHRIDRVPRKRFCKETFLHGLAHEAQMSRMDAQIAYSIVKRAFKAYYHGTAAEGKRLKALMEGMRHRQECLWLHAAKRTAEIYAAYAGLMRSEELQFAERFECVYKSLHDVLRTRVVWDDENHCRCGWASAKPSQATVSTMTAEIEVLYQQQNMAPSSAPSRTNVPPSSAPSRSVMPPSQLSVQVTEILVDMGPLPSSKSVSSKSSRYNHGLRRVNQQKSSSRPPTGTSSKATLQRRRDKCKCPPLLCEREFEREAPEITAECSQGPYVCRWLHYDETEEQFKEHRVPFPPLEVICPPCAKDELPCDPECTCTCDICTCPPAYDAGAGEEEHRWERLSATGIEDNDTDFCWLAPFREWPRVDEAPAEVAPEEEAKPNSQEGEEEEARFQCRCTCEIKRRAYPHLFTYLAPFREIKKPAEEAQVEQPEKSDEQSATEDLLSKPPPCGVSLATYRCWLQPSPSKSDSEPMAEQAPHIAVLAQGVPPKVAGISMDVTVKGQHHQGGSKVTKAAAPTANAPRSTEKTATLRISLPPSPAGKAPTKAAPAAAVPASAAPPVAPSAAKTAPAPIAARPASTPPPNQEEKLTKEDILDIIGL